MGEEKNQLIEDLSITLSSGMDLISALISIKSESTSKKFQKIIDRMIDDIKNGSQLWKAIDNSKLYPNYAVSLIRIGEESGNLPENLKIVVSEQKKQKSLRSKLISALLYPVLVLFLTLVIGIGIAWFLLPKLAQVFSSLRIELPLITKILIAVGLFLGKYGIVVVPLFIMAMIALFYLVFIFKRTKFIGESITLQTPVFKTLYKEIEVTRMGYLLGTLLNAGITIIEALDSLSQATTSAAYSKFYKFLQIKIEQGNSVLGSFNLSKDARRLFPNHIIQMIGTSEQSGLLPDTFLKINEIYQEKIDDTTKNLTVLLEPILLVIVWLGVLFVALAVILPIYSLIGGINK